jgi:peptidoglycan/LPS O-acetylase OafA/YrhL
MPRLPGLDGLRAIAVLGVVLYHLDVPWMPGGFLGVDVFFVLSGFLITTLVIEEIERTGRLGLRDFYLRRARRLLPALLVLLAVLSLLSLLVLPEERAELRRDVGAALLYVSNWSYVFTEQSYFEAVGRPPLLQHLWSLAVEEQFYLLWPAIIVVAMAAGRRRVRLVALIAAVVSTVWMAVLAVVQGYPLSADPSRAYFGTDTHAMGLLLGAGLATCWAPWRVWRTQQSWFESARPMRQRAGTAAVDLVGVAALGGLLWTFLSVGEFSPLLYRGGFLALAGCTALLVAAVAHPAGLLGRVLGVQPLRYLGERSYGIYLWHWPIALVTRPGFELPFGGWLAFVLRLALVLGAAELSYRYVERPIRAGAFSELVRRRRVDGSHPALARGQAVGSVVALGAGLATIGVFLFTTVAVTGSPTANAGNVQPPPGPSTSAPTSADSGQRKWVRQPIEQARPGPAEPASERGESVSVFGDSVVYGASAQLQAAGVEVSAAEGRQFVDVRDAVLAAQSDGSLRSTVVLHMGTNGTVEKEALHELVSSLTEHDVFLVTVSVPREWQDLNNDVLADVAGEHEHVTLLDWHEEVSSHSDWLYPDGIHLTAESGRDGYARWLLRQVTA